MASVAGHESCASVVPVAAPVESRYNAKKIAALQWLVHRLQLYADGVPGAYNDLYRDQWYPYNAAGSYNYADSYSMTVVSVSGQDVTCSVPSGDPLNVLLYTWRERDSSGTQWVTGFERHGSPQPGDVIQFSGSSKISLTCWPVILRIKSVSGTQVTFECDKTMAAALDKRLIWDAVNEQWVEHPDPVTVKIWHHAGNPELWRYIVPPDYFYGVRRTLMITDVPSDGIVTLADTAVMHPGGFYPLEPTWTLEGRRIDNNEWESVPDADYRLYILHTGPSHVALKTTAPDDGDTAPASDLTVTYNAFRASFWEKTDGSTSACRVVGFARCKWSIPDPSGSDYGTGDGKAPGWVCLKRLVDHHEIDGTTATHSSVPASGASRYPADGQCLQYGCCDQFAPAEISDGSITPFRYAYDAGVVLRDLLGACNQRLLRLVPRVPSPGAWQAQRVKHPSLMWLVGHWGIDLPNVIDGQVARFRGAGLWGTGYYTYTDTHGNEYVDLVVGGMDGVRRSDVDNVAEDVDGHFMALGTAYSQKRNPVVPGGTVVERELERMGVAVERGSGQLRSRGIAQSSVAVAAQTIIIPDLLKTATGTQHRGMATFEFDNDGNGVVRVLPLRQERKDPEMLGSRRVASVTPISGGRVRIELDNVEHVYSYIEDGPSVGDSYDRKISFWGGGGWPIMPLPSQSIDSHYEPNNYTGSRAHGAWSGDSIRADGRQFVIESVEAFGGSEAPNWGGVTYDKRGYRVAFLWVPMESNLALGTDPETYGNAEISGVYNTSTSLALTALDNPDRPDSIGADEYWFDGTQVVVGSASAGVTLRIEYRVALPGGGYKPGLFTEYVTVPTTVTVQTEILSSAWLAADDVEIDLDSATADTSGTYVVLTVGHLQTGLPVNITLITNTPAPAAEDWYSYDQNYTAYGRKRDVVIAYDDPDGFLAGLSVGDDVEFWSAAAVMMPGVTLEWTTQGADNWQPAPVDVRHGSGELVIPAGWLDDKPERLCFRAKNVQLMDHRGIVPGSLVNKLDAIARGIQWVKDGLGPGWMSFEFNKALERQAYIDSGGSVVVGPLVEGVVGPTPRNYFSISAGLVNYLPPSPAGEASTTIGLKVSSSTFNLGCPTANWEVLEAWASINASEVTRDYGSFIAGTYPCGGGDRAPDSRNSTTVEDVSFAFIGINGEGFSALASVPATPGQHAVNVTEIMQIMYTNQDSGAFASYGFILTPSDLSLGSLEGMMLPIPDTETIPVCQDGSNVNRTGWTSGRGETLEWDNIQMTNIVMRVKYPDDEFERTIIMPRLPVMA